MVVQVMGGESHLPGDGCDEHIGLVIFCACEGTSCSGVDEIELDDR